LATIPTAQRLRITNAKNPDGYVRIGRIGRPHGLDGALRATLDHSESATLETAERIFLECDGVRRRYELRAAKKLGRGSIKLTLQGVESCEAAEILYGATIFVAESDLPPTASDEFYDFHAIGCDVVTTDGRQLGKVVEIFGTGANDVMVVHDGTTEVLVPVIADVVKRLDFDAEQIVVDAVPGLLDKGRD
jgi:16S rRNA processing protein RimM